MALFIFLYSAKNGFLYTFNSWEHTHTHTQNNQATETISGPQCLRASPMAQWVKNPPARQETQ